ncbi:hypothetical protein CYY_004493 [Polysphondylium violaceum]|uniref:F-box domain-containing protein n=1 Tax=Polysphondylium violaceum TaxID=133409 RepID=A0A8J4V532_9MYCE|nr:hypothetical protein CYY_004493 [Polysphondylium violaceum]
MDDSLILHYIFKNLPNDVFCLSLVSKHWNQQFENNDKLWKDLTFSLHPSLSDLPHNYDLTNVYGKKIRSNRLCLDGKNQYLLGKKATTIWKELFQQLFIKDNLLKNHLYELNKATRKMGNYNQVIACFRKYRMLNAYQSLNRNEYLNKFKGNSQLLMILDSVLYKTISSTIKHSYDGCDDGMGRNDLISLQGILFSTSGKPIDFNFKHQCQIQGGHSDGYSMNSKFKLGRATFESQNSSYYPGEIDTDVLDFVKSCRDELTHNNNKHLKLSHVIDLIVSIFPKEFLENTALNHPFCSLKNCKGVYQLGGEFDDEQDEEYGDDEQDEEYGDEDEGEERKSKLTDKRSLKKTKKN